jgi:3-deoxy-D-manno-octulosonate cytidylyltransferase
MWRDDEPAATPSHRIVAAIPARLGSTRLPAKPLADVGGLPLAARVWHAVAAAGLADAVYVVTDADAIEDAVCAAGGQVLRVNTPCRSGTERVARALAALAHTPDFVLNVQGDEPFIGPDLLRPVVAALEAGAPIATAAAPLPAADLGRRDKVKVVRNHRGEALYFSRAPIPGALHVGLYGFRAEVLAGLPDLPRSALAAAEDLEQLDWLHAGLTIAVADVPRAPLSIDTADDLEAARGLLEQAGNP